MLVVGMCIFDSVQGCQFFFVDEEVFGFVDVIFECIVEIMQIYLDVDEFVDEFVYYFMFMFNWICFCVMIDEELVCSICYQYLVVYWMVEISCDVIEECIGMWISDFEIGLLMGYY